MVTESCIMNIHIRPSPRDCGFSNRGSTVVLPLYSRVKVATQEETFQQTEIINRRHSCLHHPSITSISIITANPRMMPMVAE